MLVSPSMTPVHNKKARHVRTTRRTQQGIIDQIARSTRIYRSHRQTYRDRYIVQTVGEHIGEGTESRLAFVRDYLSRGDDVVRGRMQVTSVRVVSVEGWLMLGALVLVVLV